METKTLSVQRLRGGTIIKTILTGSTIGWAAFVSVAGIFSFFGAEIIQWNNQYVTGIKGFIAAPFIGAFVGFLLGLFAGLFTYLGLRILSRFKPLTIEYIPSEKPIGPTTGSSGD